VHLDGRIDGNVSCERLTIGRTGLIKGKISSEHACVHGHVVGSLAAEEVVLRETAHVTGDVTHQTLEMDAGAIVNGFYKNVDEVALADRKVKALLPGKPAGRPKMEKPRRPRLKQKPQAPQFSESAAEAAVEQSDESVH
jgi:cytoskeletal protein CcmA (bactofilin family)